MIFDETSISCAPGRRAYCTVLEQQVRLEDSDDVTRLVDAPHEYVAALSALASQHQIRRPSLPEDARLSVVMRFCQFYADLILALQQRAGHRVSFMEVIPTQRAGLARVVVEVEERDVGLRAMQLAQSLLAQSCPGLGIEAEVSAEGGLEARIVEFLSFAEARVLPVMTQAMVDAADRAEIPWAKLDRFPFVSRPGDRRIRPNGGLRLGHCRYQAIFDGTFCVSPPGSAGQLVNNGPEGLAVMRGLGLPVPQGQPPELPQGAVYVAVIGNRQPLFVFETGVREATDISEQCPPPLVSWLDQVAAAIDAALIMVTFISSDIEAGGACFVDLDVAPPLDALLPAESPLLASAADALVAWAFPPGAPCRVPIVAVTATNGKTTTTNLLHWMLRQAGLQPGLAISDGLFDGQRRLLQDGDQSGATGHLHQMGNPAYDSLALETAHGGIAMSGFAFDWCDVAICLNVTRDHIHHLGIETVDDMAALKRLLPARARHGVVINADNAMSLRMLPFPNAAETCLVSTERDVDYLRLLPGAGKLFALVEDAVLVLYDKAERIPLLPVAQLAMALGGGVHYNVSNALHAAAACYLMKLPADVIVRGLATFRLNPELNPGRMVLFDALPFQVVVDFAHNPDGLIQLTKALQSLPVSGRRYINVSAAHYQDHQTLDEIAGAVAGQFDGYVCFDYEGEAIKGKTGIGERMVHYLQDRGVPRSQIDTAATEVEAARAMLERAKPGDMLVILHGKSARQQIMDMVSGWQA
ncbi:MAG: Mur ligase family protein [Pseudomonadota bacterium]